MDAINARERDQQRQRRGLQFQNVFLGWESWDVNESPQSVPEHRYASKNPILVDHLEPLDVDILNQRHAFDLPSQAVCDALVDVFFKWIAPVLPVINRHDFMRRYRNPQNPPSILLLQAILMVASRFYDNAHSSENGAISPRTFYKKVKALYDSGYERDPTTVLQAVVLLGIYWDGPDDLTESGIFYWSHLGIALAQEHGLHQSENYVALSVTERRIWKRIWWTLYTRNRSVAAAFGRPLHINSEDCTVEPLNESDFIESDEQDDSSPDRTTVLFFMQSTEDSRMKGAAQCELGLNDWLVSCPSELQWRQSRHNFWSAMLYSTFYTIVCQLHLLQTPVSSKEAQSSAFHAATSIVSIMETLQSKGELKYTPSFIICHAVVSFVTLRSQMEASIPSLLHAIRQNMEANLDMLEVLSHTWPIAAMLQEFFRTMTGPEQFERILSTAAEKCGKRARGEENDSSTPLTSSARFKRPKLQQVVLPQTRVVLQILQRETQKQFNSQGPHHNKLNTRVESMSSGALPDENRSTPMTDVDPLLDDCDASAILRSLQRIIDADTLSVANVISHESEYDTPHPQTYEPQRAQRAEAPLNSLTEVLYQVTQPRGVWAESIEAEI